MAVSKLQYERARLRGYSSRQNGRTSGECPYAGDLRVAWLEGFTQADKDRKAQAAKKGRE